MTHVASESRQFVVHVWHDDAHQARVVEEASFEAAAVAFVENFHPAATDEHTIIVIVREVGAGHEQCFRIDLDSGESQPCG